MTKFDPEQSLCESWSIGRLRPWLQLVADREIPDRLRGRVDPSDIVQQALLKAWQGESQFQGDSHEQRLAWLRVIVKNTIRDQHRHLFNTQRRGGDQERLATEAFTADTPGLAEIAVAKGPTVSAEMISVEESLALAMALESLPEEQQQVIHMRHLDRMTHAEIAERLGKSETAVRMLWVRGLRKLQRQSPNALRSLTA